MNMANMYTSLALVYRSTYCYQKPEERPTMEAVCERLKQLLIECKYDSFHIETLMANKDKVNEQGQSALHIAAQQGDARMMFVHILCSNKIIIN